MKNNFKKYFILIIFILVAFFFKSTKVDAATAKYFKALTDLNITYKTKGLENKQRNFNNLAIFSVDGKHMFCLEPATAYSTGEVKQTTFDKYSLKTYGKLTSEQVDLMNKVSTYAIKLTEPTDTKKRVSLYRTMATQALYWEIISGERTTFSQSDGKNPKYAPDKKISDSFYDKMIANVSKSDEVACMEGEYQRLVESVFEGFEKTSVGGFKLGGSILNTETLDYDEEKKVWSLTIYDPGFSYWDVVQPKEDYIKIVKNEASSNRNYCGGEVNQTLYDSITITSTKEIKSSIKLEIKTAARPKRNDKEVDNADYDGEAKIYVNANNPEKQALMDIDGVIISKYLNVKTEKNTYGLKINKKDADTGKYISGAEFELCKESDCSDDNKPVSEAVTILGYHWPAVFTVDSPGTYYYRETKAPEGYALDKEIYSVEITEDNKIYVWDVIRLAAKTITATNKKEIEETSSTTKTTEPEKIVLYQLKIKKIDASTKEPLKGVQFRICSDVNCQNIITTSETDKNGEIKVQKLNKLGTYYAIETKTLEGYILDSTPHKIEVTDQNIDDTNSYAEITIENNKKTYGFNLTKNTMDENGNVTKLDDGCNSSDKSATFSIKNSKGEDLFFKKIEEGKYKPALSTDEGASKEIKTCDGAFEVTTLTECKYTITETKAPVGVTLPSNPTKEVNVCGSDKNISFTNGFTGLEFQKKDEDGQFISGGKFVLEQKINGVWTNIKIKENNEETGVYTYSNNEGEYIFETNEGIAYISGLSAGEYRVIEKEAPLEYELIEVSEAPKVTISDAEKDGYYILTMINRKVNKYGSDASAELVITITTGRKVLNYVLIVSSLAALLVIAIIIRKKIKK